MAGSCLLSVDTCDMDERSMIDSGLYTREWNIVGTSSPTDDIGGVPTYFSMSFQMKTYNCTDSDSQDTDEHTTITLNVTAAESIEIMPAAKETLGPYYKYFINHVMNKKSDSLVNVCRKSSKSPCFDIENCCLIVPGSGVRMNGFSTALVSGVKCVPLVPCSAVQAIQDALATLGMSVEPTLHDALAFNGHRVRMSGQYVTTDIGPDEWKRDQRYARDFNHILRCDAVATATFTVSVVISAVHGKHSWCANRKSFKLVVHSIK